MSPRRLLSTLLSLVGVVALALVAAAADGSAGTRAGYKPVISKPMTTPAVAVAGHRFTVSFKVTRSDTGTPVLRGQMLCDPAVAGKVIRHAESFSRGTAQLSFVVPAGSAGKVLKVHLTIRAGGRSATRISTFSIAKTGSASLAIAGASIAEGNAGTTTLSLPVTLSGTSSRTVSVSYATSDGTATAPSDYQASTGVLTFKPGEKLRTIQVSVVGDTAIEQDETFTVALSSPVNATIAKGSATATITNDDTAVPVTAGNYRGATVNNDYVFLTVLPNRTLTGFRVNNVSENCAPPATLSGQIDWTDNVWSISPDARFSAEGSWSGSQTVGDVEYTKWYAKVTGLFSGTSVSGTLTIRDELNYQGTHYTCSTVDKGWSAKLEG